MILAMDSADAAGFAMLLGMPALIFALVAVASMWDTVSDRRLDRVAVVAPELGELVREGRTRGESPKVISYIRFTTLEGEEVEAKILTGRSVAELGYELRIKYDPAKPRRAAIVRERDDAGSIGASVTCGTIALLLVVAILVIVL